MKVFKSHHTERHFYYTFDIHDWWAIGSFGNCIYDLDLEIEDPCLIFL